MIHEDARDLWKMKFEVANRCTYLILTHTGERDLFRLILSASFSYILERKIAYSVIDEILRYIIYFVDSGILLSIHTIFRNFHTKFNLYVLILLIWHMFKIEYEDSTN